MLDTVHSQGIWLVTKAFRTSPIASLYAQITSCHRRNRGLTSRRHNSLKLIPIHHVHVTGTWHIFSLKELLGISHLSSLLFLYILERRQTKFTLISIPRFKKCAFPWDHAPVLAPVMSLSLSRYDTKVVDRGVILQDYFKIGNIYCSFPIVSDGTKWNAVVVFPCLGTSGMQVLRMNSSNSVFTAELHRLLLAISVVLKKGFRNSLFKQTL